MCRGGCRCEGAACCAEPSQALQRVGRDDPCHRLFVGLKADRLGQSGTLVAPQILFVGMVLIVRREQAEDFKEVPPRVNLPPELVAAGVGKGGLCDELVGVDRRAVRRFLAEGLVGVLHWLLVEVGVMARSHAVRIPTRLAPLHTHTLCIL